MGLSGHERAFRRRASSVGSYRKADVGPDDNKGSFAAVAVDGAACLNGSSRPQYVGRPLCRRIIQRLVACLRG